MKKKQILCSFGKCLCFLALCVISFSSCYNDDDLKNSISDLEDRVDKLEASLENVKTDISTLQALTSDNKLIASVLENEDGSYTIKFSDNTEVTIQNGEDGEDAPQITVIKDEDGIYYWGITGIDGNKTFLEDGEGNKMPVTTTAPQIRINEKTNEWEISSDGGKTWESTGVCASGESTGETSLFSEVSDDDDYAYFTLTDGTVLKVMKSKDLKCEVLSGKQYFANGEEKLIPVEMSAVSKFTVTKPDGWKASLTGKGLTIIAPVKENPYAEVSGKVSIVAVASNGKSIITEIPVQIGTAPVNISVDGQMVSTTLASGIEIYYLGVMEIDEYSPESVLELMNGYSSRVHMKTTALNNVSLSELIGKEPEAGKSYMIWSLPQSETGEYLADDIIATVAKGAPTVELSVLDVTFEGATVSLIRKGCEEYYTGIFEKSEFSPERVIEEMSFGSGTIQSSDYNGPLGEQLDFFFSKFQPGTTYVLWAIPNKVKGGYKVEELVYVEITAPTLTYGGTATVSISGVTSTLTSVTADITPGTDCYKYYYAYMQQTQLENYSTDKEVISYLIENANFSNEPKDFERTYLEPGTKGFLVAVALNDKGQLGSLVKVQADTKEISYNTSILVDVDIEPGTLSTILKLKPTGNPVKYRYIHMKENDFNTSYPYWGDEDKVEKALILNEYGVTEIDADDLENNQLVIDGISFKTGYVLYMIAVDANGNPSAMVSKSYNSAKPTFVRKATNEELWNASVPVVKIDKIVKDDRFYDISYTVEPKSDCKEYYVFVGTDDYLNGMFDEKIKYVMENGEKQTGTYSGNTYDMLPTNVYITWIDKEGRFYEVSSTTIEAPVEE